MLCRLILQISCALVLLFDQHKNTKYSHVHSTIKGFVPILYALRTHGINSTVVPVN